MSPHPRGLETSPHQQAPPRLTRNVNRMRQREDRTLPIRAKIFIAITTAAGFAVWVTAFLQWQSADPVKFACYLAIAVLAATMKIRLPGIESTMSVHFLFVLLGVLELSLPETLAIGCAAALVQSLW